MSKRRQRQQEALIEIESLRASRRKDVITCVCALITIVLVVAAKTYLTATGAIQAESMIANAIVMFASIGLAVLGGTSSINFTKTGHRIAYLRQSAGLTEEDIKAFESAPRNFTL